jgi:precorrin-6B methylase 1
MDARQFLTSLSIDHSALAEAIRDPRLAVKNANLDEKSRRVLSTRSAKALWDLLLGRDGETAVETVPLSDEIVEALEGKRGSLAVVGTGIRTVGQMTIEALAWIRAADVVLYLVADPIAEEVIRQLNPEGAMSIRGHYGEGVDRKQTYDAMVQHILSYVRLGKRTCAAFYGHPGVFAYPSHESIRQARHEGYLAYMLPGISAEDCLFADLGVDPAVNGCQSFEATDFLLHERNIDTSSQLILWQVGVVGDWTYREAGYDLKAFPLLVSRLCALYGQWHECLLYEAAVMPGGPPTITRIALIHLTPEYVTAGTTMYVPPVRPSTFNWNVVSAMGLAR